MQNSSPVITRVRPELKDRLVEAAEQQHRSVSGQLRHVLETWAENDAPHEPAGRKALVGAGRD